MKTILAIGEALIDFIPSQRGCALKEVQSFQRVVGGAPANVCSVVSKLGKRSKMITQLGEDAFGDHIIDVLNNVGVGTEYIKRTSYANTALAFVSLQEDGNRDFSFYRNPSADMLMSDDDIESAWFEDAYALHYCSVDLIDAPIRDAHEVAIKYAKEANAIISFDPNVRLPLWESESECRRIILEFIPYANILKISDEELEFITGYSDIEQAREILFQGDVELVLFTKGAEGAEVLTKTQSVSVPCLNIKALDTTGAGDACIGAFLYKLLEDDVKHHELSELSVAKLQEYVKFANAYSGYSTLKPGAIESYPTLEEMKKYLQLEDDAS